jgi:MinD superfamily P-loop ATPase
MRVVIASGKGGTGKTTFATNLATVIAARGEPVAYVDCDVEEPNGHLSLRPTLERTAQVTVPIPEVDGSRCTDCGACARACRHSAIVMLPQTILTFPSLCHGCGGCSLACPQDAIRESSRPVGDVEEGRSGALTVLQGRLDVGEAMAPPVIRAVLRQAPRDQSLIIDAPPGTSCPVIETLKPADAVLLVTEPTPFGLHDLTLMVEVVRSLGLPFGVAVNRSGAGDEGVHDFCTREGIAILAELPFERRYAEACSRGELLVDWFPGVATLFSDLADRLHRMARAPRSAPVQRVSPPPSTDPLPPTPMEATAEPRGPAPFEVVVISGKGGTGKTSIVASLAALARNAVITDCDVDAADLHLILAPTLRSRWPFSGGSEARIDADLCVGCGVCAERCRFDAISAAAGPGGLVFAVDPISCEGCGVCEDACPVGAAQLVAAENGQWSISDTRHGPLVHARLGVAQENSGKLVSVVRRQAAALADLDGRDLIITDGPPGIGCPVIAAITGAGLVLLVAEPTLSGLHDMKRVADVARHFGVPAALCVNKADINPDLTRQLEDEAHRRGVSVLGRIRYDPEVTRAQVLGLPVVEHGDGPAARDIQTLWGRLASAALPHGHHQGGEDEDRHPDHGREAVLPLRTL